jgi:hypothetical protein
MAQKALCLYHLIVLAKGKTLSHPQTVTRHQTIGMAKIN